jgi:hypothetical protein
VLFRPYACCYVGFLCASIRSSLVAGTSPYMRGHILRFGRYALDMDDLPGPLDPQPLPFDQPL